MTYTCHSRYVNYYYYYFNKVTRGVRVNSNDNIEMPK